MKKYTFNVKTNLQRGFTVLELIIVTVILTLLIAMVLAAFQGGKTDVNTKARITQLNLITLALEDYRAQCKVYPESLQDGTNNGFPGPGGGDCILKFSTPEADSSLFEYQALRSSGAPSGLCNAYHIATQVEEDISSDYFKIDDDWSDTFSFDDCVSNTSAQPYEDEDGWYDIKQP